MKKLNKIISALSVLSVFFFASCNISGISEEVKYTVSYALQNIEDDEYTIDYTETLKGTSGDSISAITKKYDGFTVQDYSSEKIEDGKNILIKFDRNIITYNLDFNEGTMSDENGNVLSSTTVSGKYGAAVTYPVPAKKGYALDGFYDSENNAAPETFTENSSYTAVYVKCTNSFTVHYLLQNLDDDEYTESTADAETLYGNAGDTTNVSAKIIPGFTAQTITQQTISSDNSTEVTVKYDRKLITLYIDLQGAQGTGYIQKKFGSTLTKDDFSKLETPVRAGYTFFGYDFTEGTEFSLENDEKTKIDTVWKGDSDAVYAIKVYLERADYSETTEKYVLDANTYGTGSAGSMTDISIVDDKITAGGKTFTYTGFKPLKSENIEIKGDDSAVINLYFDRKVVSLNLDFNGGYIIDSDGNKLTSTSISGRYGQTVVYPIPERRGYSLEKWNNKQETYPLETCTLTADWEGIKYSVIYKNGTTQSQTVEYVYGNENVVPDQLSLTEITGNGGITGWKFSEDDTDIAYYAYNKFTLPESVIEKGSMELYAVWSECYYTVNHMLQNIADDGYTCDTDETDTIYAAALSTTNVTSKEYEGFNVLDIEQQTVAEDNSTVVYVYYNRKTYSLTFNLNGYHYLPYKASEESDSMETVSSIKYGADYSFNYGKYWKTGYDNLSFKSTDGTMTIPVTGNDTVFTIENIQSDYDFILSGDLLTYTVYLKNTQNYTYDTYVYKQFTVEDSTPLTIPESLNYGSDYSFAGWYLDNNLTTELTKNESGNLDLSVLAENSESDETVNIYAKWNIKNGVDITSDGIKGAGDIVLSTGKIINVSFYYIDGLEITLDDETKEKVVAVISHQVTDSDGNSTTWRGISKDIDSKCDKMCALYYYNSYDNLNGLSNEDDGFYLSESYASLVQAGTINTEEAENLPALKYISAYSLTNYTSGWYIPAKNEWSSIIDNIKVINVSMKSIGVNFVDFLEKEYNRYWTSTLNCISSDTWHRYAVFNYYYWNRATNKFACYADQSGYCYVIPCHKF